MSTPPLLYDIAVECGEQSILIQWGNSPQWITRYRDELTHADRISLIPKSSASGLPVVTVRLTEGRRWVLFSRVYGRVPGGQIRMHCIGWQATVKGVNVKSLLWVYPTGDVECGDEPTWWKEILGGV